MKSLSRQYAGQITSLCLMLALLAGCGESTQGTAADGPPLSEPIAPIEGVWLKGDLHVHSDYSTDASNNAVATIIEFAETHGIDFLAITDHDNHVQGAIAANTWSDPNFASDSVLLLYGAEWTTSRGHGNTFSPRPYDHQRFFNVRDEPEAVIAAAARDLGIHLSANHPGHTNVFEFDFGIARSFELWGSSIWALNTRSVEMYEDLLAAGFRLTALGGSDSHHGYPQRPRRFAPNSYQRAGNYVGTPTTWAFARERTADSVVEAFGNGRVSISVNPKAPRLEFYADLDGDGVPDLMMGDNARATGEAVTFIVRVENAGLLSTPLAIDVIRNGEQLQTLFALPGERELQFTDTPSLDGQTYYRLIANGVPPPFPAVPVSSLLAGTLVALSNPIYFNFPLREDRQLQ
jgi:hypothetical protein